MALNEALTARLREALAHLPNLTEKKMFRGTAFLLNDKLLASAGDEEVMLRIDPALNDEVLEKPGTRNMIMKGKALAGWVYVHEDQLKTKKALDGWLKLAVDYNAVAKATKKKK